MKQHLGTSCGANMDRVKDRIEEFKSRHDTWYKMFTDRSAFWDRESGFLWAPDEVWANWIIEDTRVGKYRALSEELLWDLLTVLFPRPPLRSSAYNGPSSASGLTG
ncbi:hypothetical protein ACS0TY_018501 [Phlomoides rotata]